MKLPTWIPKVSRPWNPAFRSTWDVMDDNAKRWSFLFDAIVVAVMLGLLALARLHHDL